MEAFDDPDTMRAYLGVEDHKAGLRKLIEPRQTPVRLVDIGCGAGGVLLAARELGCEVVGVEPSLSHSELGRKVLGLDIRTGYLDDVALPSAAFDIVYASHVIEHTYDVREFVESLARLMAPGGVCVIVTPNASSPAARLSGSWWTMLEPVDHVSLLTSRALRAIMQPEYGALTCRTSEYDWEPIATLLAGMRQHLRRARPKPVAPQGSSSVSAAGPSMRWRRRDEWKRRALAVASAPMAALDAALDQRGCLVAELRRAG